MWSDTVSHGERRRPIWTTDVQLKSKIKRVDDALADRSTLTPQKGGEPSVPIHSEQFLQVMRMALSAAAIESRRNPKHRVQSIFASGVCALVGVPIVDAHASSLLALNLQPW